MTNWSNHFLQLPDGTFPLDEEPDPKQWHSQIESWLSAMFQSEQLALLLGSGFTTSLASASGGPAVTMDQGDLDDLPFAENVKAEAARTAERMGRGRANLEDQIRTMAQLIRGLEIQGNTADQGKWTVHLDSVLNGMLKGILSTEKAIEQAADAAAPNSPEGEAPGVRQLLSSFLLSFASRSASRERLNIFTTNYDRVIEYGCDLIGLRPLDRFVGTLEPVFRPTRLDVDMHYNPPGIRGEPRYLEGVVRLTKLHGSVDWRFAGKDVRRCALPFGADSSSDIEDASNALVIYPNANKDVETSEHPYSELFRDFSAGICRPNSVLVTYGYGFGDSHINQAISGMLTIPSTHLVIISFGTADGRIEAFCRKEARPAQTSILLGRHFGNIQNLVTDYLPKPAIDQLTWRRADMLRRRLEAPGPSPRGTGDEE